MRLVYHPPDCSMKWADWVDGFKWLAISFALIISGGYIFQFNSSSGDLALSIIGIIISFLGFITLAIKLGAPALRWGGSWSVERRK